MRSQPATSEHADTRLELQERSTPTRESERCARIERLDALFVGNSYTRMCDLPDQLKEFGRHAGIELHAAALTVDGKNFDYHAARAATARKLADADWDVVVLQSHSLDTLRDPEGFLAGGQALVEMVRRAGAKPVLFETWARAAGHSLYDRLAQVDEPATMQQIVHRRYQELARLTRAEVVHVGDAWRAVRRVEPEVGLHARDSNHPGKLGAYLTATVLFAALTDVTPVGNVGPPPPEIDRDTARLLQAKAAAVVRPACLGPVSARDDPEPAR